MAMEIKVEVTIRAGSAGREVILRDSIKPPTGDNPAFYERSFTKAMREVEGRLHQQIRDLHGLSPLDA